MNDPDIAWIKAPGDHDAILASKASGTGPLFIWGHTLLGSMAQEDRIGTLGWRALQDQARIVRYDARGHGESESTASPADYTWPHLARDMWTISDFHNTQKTPVILGGASMGCATALHAACQQPACVQGLVLMIPPTAWDQRHTTAKPYRGFASSVELTRGLPLKLLKLLDWLPPVKHPDLKTRISRVTACSLSSANPTGVSAAMRGASLSDLPALSDLARLQIPTLILAWANDPVHPLNTALTLARTLPQATLDVSTTAEQADRWELSVRRFISSLCPPSQAST